MDEFFYALLIYLNIGCCYYFIVLFYITIWEKELNKKPFLTFLKSILFWPLPVFLLIIAIMFYTVGALILALSKRK